MKLINLEKWVTNPIQSFISKSTTGAFLLFLATLLALIFANTGLKTWYFDFWEIKLGFKIGNAIYLDKTILHWINDGLMAIFFFVVGLELKREFIGGELSDIRKSILPIGAAFGGMICPAVIYFLCNQSGATVSGWGIPMATDIAFALGVLYLLGDRIPTSIKVFLTALAIADDLGAVLVIAFFYTSEISYLNLAIGIGFLLILYSANKLGVRNTTFYGIVGIGGVWLFFLMSGIHATIAAVLLAFVIPADVKIEEHIFIDQVNAFLKKFKNADQNNAPTLTNEQLFLLENISETTKNAMTPLQRLEHKLHPFVSYLIMPIFAFANAGVTFSADSLDLLLQPVSIGVMLGLLVGKFVGVVGFSALLIRLKFANLPENMSFNNLLGVGFLTSIGFTMSLFVTNLAFDDPKFILESKIAIFVASFLGGIIGFMILKKQFKDN